MKSAAISRRVGLVGIGKSEAGADINGGEYIALQTGRKDGHRVHLDQVSGQVRHIIFSSQFLPPGLRSPDQQRAVKVLKKYKWFITPSFPITFMFEVMELDKEKGRHDKAVNRLFIEYFEAEDWKNLEIMVNGWKPNPLLKKRYKILSDSVDTVKAASKKGINEANAILPTLITQIDGALTDYLNSKGLQWESDYDDRVVKGKVKKVGRKSQFKNAKPKVLTTPLDDLANDIFLNILFQRSQRGKPLVTPFNFNRHKIIHGENVRYGRKDYLVRAFMVLDLLAHF